MPIRVPVLLNRDEVNRAMERLMGRSFATHVLEDGHDIGTVQDDSDMRT